MLKKFNLASEYNMLYGWISGRNMYFICSCDTSINKVGPVGQVLAGPLFFKVKTKFCFTKSK